MIPPEQRAEIRRLYYAEHWRIGTIATTLGVHHDTVRVAIERFIRPGTQVRPSTLDPYKPVEVRGPAIGRIRLRRVSDSSAASLLPFVQEAVTPGTVVITDG